MYEKADILKDLEKIVNSDYFDIDTTPIKIDDTLCVKCNNRLAGYCLVLGGECPYIKICAGYRRRSKK